MVENVKIICKMVITIAYIGLIAVMFYELLNK